AAAALRPMLASSRTVQRARRTPSTSCVQHENVVVLGATLRCHAEMQQSDSWPFFEIWTRNRVYHIDTALVCVAVVTRATGAVEGTHPLRGARLTGANDGTRTPITSRS